MKIQLDTSFTLSLIVKMFHLILLVTLFWTICLWKKNRQYRELANKLKHDITSYPFLGISYLLFGKSEDQMKAIQRIGRETTKQGGCIAAWFGPKIYACITDPVLADFVLKTCLDKDDLANFMQTVSGNGTIFAPVSIWHRRRKVLAKAFTVNNLAKYISLFSEQSDILVEKLKSKSGNGLFPIWSDVKTSVFSTVCQTVLGVKLEAKNNEEHQFSKTLEEGISLVISRICQPLLHSDLIYKAMPSYRRLKTLLAYTHNFIDEIIIKILSEIEQKEAVKTVNNFNLQSDESKTEEYKTFLELMIEKSRSPQMYSQLELREEVIVLLVAGSDTSAVGLSFALAMMARYPDVQEKVYDELKDVFGDSKRPVEPDDLSRLKYMDVVLKEILRLYPPGYNIFRKVDRDVTLPSGITLPKGCGVVVNIWALHRNKKYWGEDAESFRPERFLEAPLKHPAQFMPFSYGPRNCIGYKFAMLSTKTFLATILRHYRVLPATNIGPNSPPPPLRLKINIIMTDADGFTVALEQR